jgi:hypothetical protein
MHRGHDHHYDDHSAGGDPDAAAGAGHNRQPTARGVVQWQRPHCDAAHAADPVHDHDEADLDLVEAAFVEAFLDASDPTSFLRLAQVPFEADARDGAKLALLRVEIDAVADVGAVTPHLGGASFRYDPLPARMVSRRKRLRFVYYDGTGIRALALAQVRGLAGR